MNNVAVFEFSIRSTTFFTNAWAVLEVRRSHPVRQRHTVLEGGHRIVLAGEHHIVLVEEFRIVLVEELRIVLAGELRIVLVGVLRIALVGELRIVVGVDLADAHRKAVAAGDIVDVAAVENIVDHSHQ